MKWLKEIKKALLPVSTEEKRANDANRTALLSEKVRMAEYGLRKVTREIPRNPFPSVTE